MKNTELIYGYCRISTKKQSLARQIKNIEREFPTATIITEAYTGTKLDRPEWNRLYKRLKRNSNAIVVFDEVSRMSRNAEEGFQVYMELYEMGVELIFLKEKHINTESYRNAINGIIQLHAESGDTAADRMINSIMDAINEFMQAKVKQDIYLAFSQAETEVEYLHQRTKEGIERARDDGKQIGGVPGKKLITKKSIEKKAEILKHAKEFGGTLNDVDCMKLTGLSRNTYYRYKQQLREEQNLTEVME